MPAINTHGNSGQSITNGRDRVLTVLLKSGLRAKRCMRNCVCGRPFGKASEFACECRRTTNSVPAIISSTRWNPKIFLKNLDAERDLEPWIGGGIGGDVWESNPPEHTFAVSLSVLKTEPLTRTDSPPHKTESREPGLVTLIAGLKVCQAHAV